MEGTTISSAITLRGDSAKIVLEKQLSLRLEGNKTRNYGQIINLLLLELIDLKKTAGYDSK